METAACRLAIKQLTTYSEDPNLHHTELEAAIAHIGTCPHCQRRVGSLVRALTTDAEDRLTCQECEDLLLDYLQAVLERRASEVRWQPVTLHLATCSHCAAEYTTLSELTALAFGEKGEDPPNYPTPDLSFITTLEKETSKLINTHLNKLGHLVIEFSAELVRVWQARPHQPSYATSGLKAAGAPKTLGQLSLKEGLEDLEVTISVEEAKNDPTRCAIEVEVNIPSRGGWPHLADTEVTVKQNNLELATQLTDAFGKAVFEGVAIADLAHLVFEIAPNT